MRVPSFVSAVVLAAITCGCGNVPKKEPAKPDWPKGGKVVKLPTATWVILSAEDKGSELESHSILEKDRQSTGRFVKVRFRVTNTSKKEVRGESPVLIDSQGREFKLMQGAFSFVPRGEKTLNYDVLGPSLPQEFVAVYEVAADSAGLKARVEEPGRSFGEFALVDLALLDSGETPMDEKEKDEKSEQEMRRAEEERAKAAEEERHRADKEKAAEDKRQSDAKVKAEQREIERQAEEKRRAEAKAKADAVAAEEKAKADALVAEEKAKADAALEKRRAEADAKRKEAQKAAAKRQAEKAAAPLLKFAKKLFDNGDNKKAKERYEEIIKLYPDTEAAKEAQKDLDLMKLLEKQKE